MESSRHDIAHHYTKKKKKHKHHHKRKHKRTDRNSRHTASGSCSDSDSNVEARKDESRLCSRLREDLHSERTVRDGDRYVPSARGNRPRSLLAGQDAQTAEWKQNVTGQRQEENELELKSSYSTSSALFEVSRRDCEKSTGKKGKRRTHEEDFESKYDIPLKKHRGNEKSSRFPGRRHRSRSGSLSAFDSHKVVSGRKSEHSQYRETESDGDSDNNKSQCQAPISEYDFDWEAHRYVLDRMFFREEDFIRRGSVAYDDFWSFLHKYLTFQKKKVTASKRTSLTKKPPAQANPNVDNVLDLPSSYDKRYRINLSLVTKDVQAPFHREHSQRGKRQEELSDARVAQFRQILLHYLDFGQKQKFQKLKKIREGQRNLPIYSYKRKIVDTVKEHQVVVVAGDTGCGKSTQVPQYLLEAGFTNIACTQPRRIACISLAKRVGFETLNEYGSEVAFQVRFEKSRTQRTRILFLTEGLLLRQMGTDPLLEQYSVIVIDEVHERHIQTDFLLGVVKCLLRQRNDLKLVLMSATINIELFSSYFDSAPIVKVPGRLYPIQLQYQPLVIDEQTGRSERLDPRPYLRILQAIDKKYSSTERGDVLMFLSGMSEIMSVVEAAKDYALKTKSWIILPLHSALSVAEQDKVFDYPPEGVRKCIVSTNIAETSVTIDGVRFVVDSGKVKEMSFDTKYKMQRLQEFWISQASAEQRKGRAGRTGPGVCYRLYSESDYLALQQYSTPEIQRVPLDSLILHMLAMGLPDARKFPFLEPPDVATIEVSVAFLKEQGALTSKEELTPMGEMLAELPVDVVIGKMLLMASIFQMVEPVLCTAATLSVQSPFTSKAHRDYDAMHARKSLESDHGDPLTLLNAFDEWVQIKAEGRDSKKWCRRRGLEQQRFYEMSKLKTQFRELLEEHKLVDKSGSDQSVPQTSAERRQRHAERKHLRSLRHEQSKQSRKRKVLKLENEDWEFEEQSGDEKEAGPDLETDIKDLEFRLTHDLNKMQEQSNEMRGFTLRDVNLLKVILCSGLYPQVAIADEHNSFKADSEQAFHTKSKGFVLLHPTSSFGTNPEVLQLQDRDVVEPQDLSNGETRLKGLISYKHQLLTYVSLLETTKPYLVGTMRVPALQTLLLFASSLDTNEDCTRILCDEWLELCFTSSEDAEKTLSSVVQLRSTWLHLLNLKLQEHTQSEAEASDLDNKAKKKVQSLQKVLGHKLAQFLDSHVLYTLRRVLAAEMRQLYMGPQLEVGGVCEALSGVLKAGGDPHPIKGGIRVTDYLTYNCLQSGSADYASYLQKHWICPRCKSSLIVTLAEKIQHEQQCHLHDLAAEERRVEEQIQEQKVAGLRRHYHCDICGMNLNLTTKELLRHRQACKTEPSSDS